MGKSFYRFQTVLAFMAIALLFGASTPAQSNFDKKALLKKFLDASERIPAQHRKLLSSGMQNFLQLASSLNSKRLKAGFGDDGGTFNPPTRAQAVARALRSASFAGIAGPGGTIRISNPDLDFVTSVVTGFTQSETSTGWCGNTIVSGYNDSGALLRTLGVNPQGAASFNGVSVSVNGGKSFVDLGFLNPGADPANSLNGDPNVACSSSTQFYYSSIFATATPPDAQGNRNPLTAVSVSSSSSGGLVWGPPVAAVAKDGFLHSLDKPWMAADPTNPMRLFVTYTDFDFSGTSTACPKDFRQAIELVRSNDGGGTWSAPVVVDEQCGAANNAESGSNVIVSPGGKVYVAFEFIPLLTPDNEIHFTRSTDNGKTFSKPIVITADVVPNGSAGLQQGGFRINEFPQLAVDRTNSSSRGTVYIAWSDGRNNVIPDIGSLTGTYAYPDILVAKSTNMGLSFGAPSAVSPTPADFTGAGRDQFFPGIAVDKDGEVGVCYYDRRGDPENTVIDRFCSVSTNRGASWTEQRVSSSNWLPMHASDQFIVPTYIGDYDALTSDFLLQNDGFFGSFEIQTNGNPDVFGKKVQ
jgi:hypothetical protein